MKIKTTPLLDQYIKFKEQNPEVLLLMRVGDFYEAFGEDAKILSKTLNIALTRKASGNKTYTELAGFPHHAIETYIGKLIDAKLKIAICEQLEEANGKTLIKRDISEILTPGIGHINAIGENRNNNFLASIYFSKNEFGIAFLDISTGEFVVGEGDKQYIDTLLNNYRPKEIIVSKTLKKDFDSFLSAKFYITYLHDWIFDYNYANSVLLKHFKSESIIKSFGINSMKKSIIAAGASLHYLESLNHKNITHISYINTINSIDHIYIDKFTVKNLEILEPLYSDGGKSLLDIIDCTITPMASRLLKKWIVRPLINIDKINNRLNIVGFFTTYTNLAHKIIEILKNIGDIDRIISKIALKKIKPAELIKLSQVLISIQDIKHLLEKSSFGSISNILSLLNPCQQLREKICCHLIDNSAQGLQIDYIIAGGISKELDELRKIKIDSNKILSEIQTKQSQASKITNLKLGFSNNIGYYFEITNKFKNLVPDYWIRKQSLVNVERYTIPELVEYGNKISSIDVKIQDIENKIYEDLLSSILNYIKNLQKNSMAIAKLDVLLSFARLSAKNNYIKPTLINSQDQVIEIKEARHPVIEKTLPNTEKYISNNLYLDNTFNQIMLITGPNMGGKSSYLRQTAIIVLLAQIGCYVPASSACISIVDRIFVRAGASDNIALGESTFMVEMLEVASILNNLTNKSLVLLDEIGRGTSTYDGIAIAQAIVEYIAVNSEAKVLFATHYHELQSLEDHIDKIKNYKVLVKEIEDKIFFLRKIEKGASNKSFGINVAKLAGFPSVIIDRASAILADITSGNYNSDSQKLLKDTKSAPMDNNLLEIIYNLKNLDIDAMSPIDALLFLQREKAKLINTTSANILDL
ncbi:MAG: DNA mismatch repair protein MutS [Solitalea-like symbiont of Tyrophagus putrescentiae]